MNAENHVTGAADEVASVRVSGTGADTAPAATGPAGVSAFAATAPAATAPAATVPAGVSGPGAGTPRASAWTEGPGAGAERAGTEGSALRPPVGEPPVLVLGYGNTIRRDDGVGVRVVELLAADPRLARATRDGSVIVLTAYQLTPELAVDIGSASLVIFVDADVRGLPGSIEVRELTEGGDAHSDDRAGSGSSSHHVGAGELLALAQALSGGTPRAMAVGIGVADLELGEGLSAPVEAALPRAVEVLVRLLLAHRPL